MLVRNAGEFDPQAISRSAWGSIFWATTGTYSARLVSVLISDGEMPSNGSRAPLGRGIQILVQAIDNGPGVLDKEKILDAFVTTKAKGSVRQYHVRSSRRMGAALG